MSGPYSDFSTDDFDNLTVEQAEALLDLAEATYAENNDEEQVYDENGPVAPNV